MNKCRIIGMVLCLPVLSVLNPVSARAASPSVMLLRPLPKVQSPVTTPVTTRTQLQALSEGIANDRLSVETATEAIKGGMQSGQIDLAQMPMEEAVMMMMQLIADDANQDMQALVEDMQETRERKASLRATNSAISIDSQALRAQAAQEMQALDTKTAIEPDEDLAESQQMRMQMLMDRKAKAQEILTNLMKKQSETQSNIISNIK